MKFVGVSGVFALASAGLAMASTEPVAPVKEETAVLVSVAEVDAAVIDKKVADTGAVTQATAGCDTDPGLPICAEAVDKN